MVNWQTLREKCYDEYIKQSKDNIDLNTFNDYLNYGDSTEHSCIKYYFDNKTRIENELFIQTQKNKENKIKEILKDIIVKNSNNNKCPLCAIDNNCVDTGIFFLAWNSLDVNEYFKSKDVNVVIDDCNIKNHLQHIFVIKPNDLDDNLYLEDIKKTNNKNINIEDVDIINIRIKKLTILLEKLERSGSTWSREYQEANNALKNFIEIKNKIVNGDTLNINGKIDFGELLDKYLKD